jgi:hypothetical protein
MGPEPPVFQSVLSYTRYSCKKAAVKGRTRAATAAIRIAANIFLNCNVECPAGVCTSVEVPTRLDKLPKWLGLLASLPHREALSRLATSHVLVPDKVYRLVELEFNAGIAAASSTHPCFANLRLQPGSLAGRIACLSSSVCESTPVPLPVGPPLVGTESALLGQQGAFFYIGAGVGCGIREALRVCSVAALLLCYTAVAFLLLLLQCFAAVSRLCCCHARNCLYRLSCPSRRCWPQLCSACSPEYYVACSAGGIQVLWGL